MTPEQIATVRTWLLITKSSTYQKGGKLIEAFRYLGMTLDALEAQQDQAKAVEQVRKDVFEEACVLICQDCRNNHPLELHPDYGIYQHKHKRTGEYEDCKADAIRWEMASGSR